MRGRSFPPSIRRPRRTTRAPYFNRQRRSIGRQLDMLRSRLLDTRFAFMFDSDDPLHPGLDGHVTEDLGTFVASWVGGPTQVTIVDVSGIPAEVLGTVVGTMMQLIYDTLFWGMTLPIGGRQQPLLVVVDEAHRFLPQ